ncbi:MAG: DinB family protein [Bdellovibrionales bacterium]|nr:DinB family protein [Bdellovibrionales bacterium]
MTQEFIAELQQEAETTRALLAAVPESSFDWSPHAKSMSIGKLATHVATIPGKIMQMLDGDSFDMSSIEPVPSSYRTPEALVSCFDDGVRSACEILSRWDENKLDGMWQFTADGKPFMEKARKSWVRMLVLNHLYHHRGQLSVYLRLLDVPVPSVYGPTADVNPFASA